MLFRCNCILETWKHWNSSGGILVSGSSNKCKIEKLRSRSHLSPIFIYCVICLLLLNFSNIILTSTSICSNPHIKDLIAKILGIKMEIPQSLTHCCFTGRNHILYQWSRSLFDYLKYRLVRQQWSYHCFAYVIDANTLWCCFFFLKQQENSL